jgi:hypothetical protein
MTWGISPVEHVYRADFQTNTISSANFPINCDVSTMYAELLRWFNRPPDVVPLMLTYNLTFLLEIRIDWQSSFTYSKDEVVKILTLLLPLRAWQMLPVRRKT